MKPRPPHRYLAGRINRRLHRRADSEVGMAMVITIVVMMVIVILIGIIYQEGTDALPLARNAQNYQAALQAADAGVDDYIYRLDNMSSYWSSTDSTNKAFTSWVPVPGKSVNEWYRYYANTSTTAQNGVINLTVSGAAGQNPALAGGTYSVRTIKQSLKVAGFTDFLYYTNYEITDPNLESGFTGESCGRNCTDSYTKDCAVYSWQKNGNGVYNGYGPDPICYNGSNGNGDYIIYFGGGDKLNGPVFTNDGFHVSGPITFASSVNSVYNLTSGSPCPAVPGVSSCSFGGAGALPPAASGTEDTTNITAPSGTWPQGGQWQQFPANNQNMTQDLALNGGGCEYQGPVTVTFNGATMSVSLPSGSSVVPVTGVSGVTCTGNNISYPPNGLIYDESGTGSCGGGTCAADVSVQGTVGDTATQCSVASPPAVCNQGVTIGSDDTISITGSLVDGNMQGNEIIGLSATNFIKYPYESSGLTVDAAMVALNDSIYYPGYTSGGKTGTLTIEGSLAQNFRGPVATSSGGSVANGYVKNYNWDPRLQFLQPPYFTSPTLPAWQRTTMAECNQTSSPSATTC